MVKILHATDVHTDLKKYEAIVNHANSSDVDAVLITGDLTDKDSEAYHSVYAQLMGKSIKASAGKEVLDIAKKQTELAKRVMPLVGLMQQTGARPEDLEGLIEGLDADKDKKTRLKADAKDIKINAEKLQKLGEEFKKSLEADPNYAKINSEVITEFRKYQTSEIKSVNEVLVKSKKPVYAVTGNHDPNFISELMDIHFLDKDGSADIKGIRFAGTPSTYEMPKGIPQEDYSHLEDYVVEGEGKKVEGSREYNRLKDEKIDVLATHGGLADRLERDNYKHKKPDQVMYKLMKDKEVKLNLSGHFHEELIKKVDNILQLNPGTERVYEIEMEKKDKGVYVNKVTVYKYVLDVGTSEN